MRVVILLFILLTTAILAGCVSNEAASPQSTIAPAAPATYDDQSGGIEGLIVDDQLAPVEGAQVGLTGVDAALTTSDAAGHFSLSNIPPGTHTLAANKLGYESMAKKVDIIAGEVLTNVQLALVPLAIEVPYPELLIHKGIIRNGVGVILTATCQNCGTAETFYRFNNGKGLPDDMSVLVIEAEWRTQDFLGIDIVDRTSGAGVYWRIRDKSPIHYVVDACGTYTDPPYYASKPMPCEDGALISNKIQAETWYIGGFQQETHTLDPVCRGNPVLAYRAGCYGLGYIPELVFTDYYTVFHGEKPADIGYYTALPDR